MIDTLFLFAVLWTIVFVVAWALVGVVNYMKIEYTTLIIIRKINDYASTIASILILAIVMTIYAHYFGFMTG